MIRCHMVFLVRKTDASTTLQDEVVFCHLSNNVISRTSRPKTLYVIGIRTALTENQRPFPCVITQPVTRVTNLPMPLPERVMFWESVELLLGCYHLRTRLVLGVCGDLI